MIAKVYFAVISIIASEGGGGGLLSVDGGLAFWTTLTFLILLFILGKFAWRPILTALKQREEAIKESLAQAELAKEEAKKSLLKISRVWQKQKRNLRRLSSKAELMLKI